VERPVATAPTADHRASAAGPSPASGEDVWRLDATAQASLVATGAVSPRELVAAAIARIEALDPRLGAVVVPLFDHALAQTADLDRAAPFAGVPLLLKDASQELAGTPHWVGSAALAAAGHTSVATTALTQRFLDLGMVIVGKSSVPELSSGTTTEPPGLPATHNPWDLARTAGGSSGGAAAAVAAGLVPVAHGADATGSLRFPASCCGVLTLKPTRGRIPGLAPAGLSDPLGVWSEMVLTRSTRDLAALFAALSGQARPRPGTGRPRRALRVGLLTYDVLLGLPVRDECRDAVERVGRHLEALGCAVSASYPGALDHLFERVHSDISTLTARGRFEQLSWVGARAGAADHRSLLSPGLAAQAEIGSAVTDGQVRASVERVRQTVAPIEAWWQDRDVLVTPTMRRPAWALGRDAGPGLAGVFPAPFSFTGQPALSVPAAWTEADLPVGVQLVGRRGDDEVLLDLSAELEQLIGWTARWPAFAGAPVGGGDR
jgi:amidase